MPDRAVELHPEALIEARAAFDWYRERNPAAATAFLAEIDLAIEEIAASPERWPGFFARDETLSPAPLPVFRRLPHC